MINWREISVPPSMSIVDALRRLDETGTQLLVVVDEDDRLVGTITDGDFRRAYLRSVSMDAAVETIANTRPKTLPVDAGIDTIREAMVGLEIPYVPLLDETQCIAGIAGLNEPAVAAPDYPHWILLMAGGKGMRLRPLTAERPKPLLEIGGRPILELIIQNLSRQGFRRFYVSLGYMADMVKAHFGDGSAFDVEIRYLEEKTPLGTAGALGLITEQHELPLFVMNGDLLTKVKFGSVLDYHRRQSVDATMCVREFKMEVPFGVVKIVEGYVAGIVEKPVEQHLINAGIYLFEPKCLALIEPGEALDIPELLDRARDADFRIGGYPIHEFWLDIGRHDDYLLAKEQAGDLF